MRCGGSGSVAVAPAVGLSPPHAFKEDGCLLVGLLCSFTPLRSLCRAVKLRMMGSLYQYTGQSENVYPSESLLVHLHRRLRDLVS